MSDSGSCESAIQFSVFLDNIVNRLLYLWYWSHKQFRDTQPNEIFGGDTQSFCPLGEYVKTLLRNINCNSSHGFLITALILGNRSIHQYLGNTKITLST